MEVLFSKLVDRFLVFKVPLLEVRLLDQLLKPLSSPFSSTLFNEGYSGILAEFYLRLFAHLSHVHDTTGGGFVNKVQSLIEKLLCQQYINT